MSTTAQIAANQKNAQQSTGPVTEAGKLRSSQNARKHGLTGQTLVISDAEREAYQAHVNSYFARHAPFAYQHRELVQQLADAHWSLHQVFVQQANTLSLMNAITIQMSEAGDPVAAAAAIAPVARTLNTLSIYETRRRRAALAIQEQLDQLEQILAEQFAAAQKTKPTTRTTPEEIGSVCSTAPIDPLLRQLEAEDSPEQAAQIRKLAGL